MLGPMGGDVRDGEDLRIDETAGDHALSWVAVIERHVAMLLDAAILEGVREGAQDKDESPT